MAPGRWHERGSAVVYASESLALAVLETIAHLEGVLPDRAYAGIHAELPDEFAEFLTSATLPANWMEDEAATRAIGRAWLRAGTSVALAGPSVLPAVRLGGTNYLLNPNHHDFAQVSVLRAERFFLDRRLLFRPA